MRLPNQAGGHRAQEEEPVRWVQALGPGTVSGTDTRQVLGVVAQACKTSNTQELWKENGKLEATKGFLKREQRRNGKAAMSAHQRHAEGRDCSEALISFPGFRQQSASTAPCSATGSALSEVACHSAGEAPRGARQDITEVAYHLL